jgi:TolA-binding protein
MRRITFVAAVGALILAGAAAAQTSLDDPLDDRSAKRLDRMEKVVRELRAIIFQGRETGAPVVVQPADTESQIGALSDKLGDLDHTLTRLNGEMEVIRHDLDETRRESNDLRVENATLKARLDADDKLLQSPAVQSPAQPLVAPAQGLNDQPVDAATALAAARSLLVSGDAAGAEAALRTFLDRYGDGPLGPEGRYFLGRVLIARQAWPDAATADIGAIRGWPKTRWAPDAVLDLARALTAMNKPADACQALDELARRYPAPSPQVQTAAAALRAQAKCG